MQARKWLEIVDNESDKAYVDDNFFNTMCSILKLINHPDLHQSMYDTLEDYAWLFITAVFCTKNKINNKRFYTSALLEIARKNFKTFNSAVVFIISMIIEPKFSRFFSVAPDYQLSSELKEAFRKIVLSSPVLEDKFKILRDSIKCKISYSEYKPLAYSRDRMDGKFANLFLADEAGALDTYPIEAMRSSQINLENKLGIIISTQYPNDNNALIDEIDICKKVLDGLLDRDDYFSLLYQPDEEIINHWETNDLVIYHANPVAVNNKNLFNNLVQMRELAIIYENKRENYLCKHNNIKYRGLGVESFVDIELVKKCRIKQTENFWHGKVVYVALDLALTDDNVSVAMVCEYNGLVYSKVFAFIPLKSLDKKSKKEKLDYKRMIKKGYCFACGDRIIDYAFVEDFIINLENKYGVIIHQIGYDLYNARSTVNKLENHKYETVQIKQHSSVLHAPTKLLYEYILAEKFRYDENELLEINFENARCTEDTNKNKYVNKKKSNGKVDMVVSLINAMYLLQENQFVYDDFGAISI